MTKPPCARYRRTNWKSYNDALKRRGSLLIWLDKAMVWRTPKAGRNGRPPVFSDGAIQLALLRTSDDRGFTSRIHSVRRAS